MIKTFFPPFPTVWIRFAAIAVFAPGAILAAELTWETTLIETRAAAGQSEVQVSFPFQCHGEGAITVREIETSCGCTAATLDKRTYVAGESGAIEVVFEVGSRQGQQEKEIFVVTETGKQALRLRVDIHEWLQVSPRLLTWRIGDALAPKEITLTFESDAPASEPVISIDHPELAHAVLKPAESTGRYQVHITPASTATRTQTIVHIKADNGSGGQRDIPVYVIVR